MYVFASVGFLELWSISEVSYSLTKKEDQFIFMINFTSAQTSHKFKTCASTRKLKNSVILFKRCVYLLTINAFLTIYLLNFNIRKTSVAISLKCTNTGVETYRKRQISSFYIRQRYRHLGDGAK